MWIYKLKNFIQLKYYIIILAPEPWSQNRNSLLRRRLPKIILALLFSTMYVLVHSSKGQCLEIFDHFCCCLKDSTWAPYEQAKTVSLNFVFTKIFDCKGNKSHADMNDTAYVCCPFFRIRIFCCGFSSGS